MALVTADDAIGVAVMAAQGMCDYAVCFEPGTGDMSIVMGHGAGGPVTLGEAGAKWTEAAGQFQNAQQTLQNLVAGLPHDYWDGDDRTAFDNEMTQLQAQLGDSHNYAMAVGIVLDALAVPIGLWPILCSGIGIAEFTIASAFYAAAASGIGDVFGVSETIFGIGETVTDACVAVMNASMAILIAVMAAATAAIAISDAADVDAQKKNGDTTALSDFGKATVTSLPEVGFNLAVDHFNNKDKDGEGDEPHVPGKHEAGGDEGGTHEDPSTEPGGDADGTHEAPTGDGGRHEDPQGGTGDDTGNTPGTHEDPSDEPGPDSSPGDGTEGSHHAPRHLKPPDLKDIGKDRGKEYGIDKTREKVGDASGTGLSSLINGLIGPSDQPPEKWGEGPQTESV